MRPEILARRVVNQYRARDVIPYLGLRYYFSNICSRRDIWAQDVAKHAVITRSEPAYFKSPHFKELRADASLIYRDIFLPGPNEAFAEAALISECSKHHSFALFPCVFSYKPASASDTRGVFAPYYEGFKERHNAITEACRENPDAQILYTDIKQFYPSISSELALQVWRESCSAGQVGKSWQELGEKILLGYAEIGAKNKTGKGLLTGPMFSHFLANQVMRKIDEKMMAIFPNKYFRYVDDVVLVGTEIAIQSGRTELANLLEELGLQLHSIGADKDFILSTAEWIKDADDLNGEDGLLWARFVGRLKQFLATRPSEREQLAFELHSGRFRIPLPNYSLAIQEAPWRLRLQERLLSYSWLRKKILRVTTSELVSDAIFLRDKYTNELRHELKNGVPLKKYQRKRCITKIRFLAGRLIYLGDPNVLHELSHEMANYSELRLLSEVIKAVVSRDVSMLLQLGTNAIQAAAQVLALEGNEVACRVDRWDETSLAGLAILRINGVRVEGPINDPLNRFSTAKGRNDEISLMHSTENPFLRELACLRGVGHPKDHGEIINSAFDWDETLAFDGILHDGESGY